MKRRQRAALALSGLGLAAGLAACAPRDPQLALNTLVSTGGLNVQLDRRYGPGPRQTLDVYAQPGLRNAPVVLFIHGGSWQNGDKAGYRFVGESLARAGYVVGVMNYRLAPQDRYPSYVQDAAQALAWLRSHAADYGGGADNLFVMGHSAGAFNAAALLDNHRFLEAAGVPVAAVRGVIGLAGPYAYDFRSDDTRVAFPQGGDPDDIMPDRHVRVGAPPHLLLVAADDTLVHPLNAERMAQALQRAQVPVTLQVLPGLNHVTIVAALARPLGFLGDTRAAAVRFIEERRLP